MTAQNLAGCCDHKSDGGALLGAIIVCFPNEAKKMANVCQRPYRLRHSRPLAPPQLAMLHELRTRGRERRCWRTEWEPMAGSGMRTTGGKKWWKKRSPQQRDHYYAVAERSGHRGRHRAHFRGVYCRPKWLRSSHTIYSFSIQLCAVNCSQKELRTIGT